LIVCITKDQESEQLEEVNERCENNNTEKTVQREEKAKKELEDYIKKLLSITSLTPKIKK